MCRTFPDAADLFSGVNALCRHGICRQSSTSENAVLVEIQQRCIVNSEVADLYVRRESDPNKRLDDIFKGRVNSWNSKSGMPCQLARKVKITVTAGTNAGY